MVMEGVELEPKHVRPRTLHTLVVCLWVTVGAFAGLAIASTIGTVQLMNDTNHDFKFTEYLANIGSQAGPFFVAGAVGLAAIAVVEAILITLGHVSHIEQDLEPAQRESA